MTPAEVVADLHKTLAGQIVGTFNPGDRVTVTLQGVEAGGQVGHMSVHWHKHKGLRKIPVVLDGTGVQVEVDMSLVAQDFPVL